MQSKCLQNSRSEPPGFELWSAYCSRPLLHLDPLVMVECNPTLATGGLLGMSADMPSSTYLGMSAAYPGGMPGYVGDIPGRYTRHTRRHTKLGMSATRIPPVSPGVFEAPVYPQTYRRCVLMLWPRPARVVVSPKSTLQNVRLENPNLQTR